MSDAKFDAQYHHTIKWKRDILNVIQFNCHSFKQLDVKYANDCNTLTMLARLKKQDKDDNQHQM